MNANRIIGLLALTASIALGGCSGSGAPTTATPGGAPATVANSYTGPAAATADIQFHRGNHGDKLGR